ncbi:Low affinity iron permease [Hyaloscypha bicolor E]|uniref:Low affinity iron permease n=1 Tax=Hyaloscypha bicolor E TaxID=1095630 RepID=A0A2J6TAW8_9HELO|nr:Low affinity iron permease [Hyaloscypha bicolor E]PMD60108.1 Low affinity iron permease [Hyaloscypha bicolor E]
MPTSEESEMESASPFNNGNLGTFPDTSRVLDLQRSFEILDSVTNVAGSRLVFLGTLALLLVWTIFGIVLGATDVWQIVMQNASSIQCYVSDTLLMRQQANATHSFLVSIAEMRSRSASCLRIVRSLSPSQLQELKDLQTSKFKKSSSLLTRDQNRKEGKANLFDRACDAVALATGSLPALTVYLVGVFVWLGLGPLFKWGNIWQLYINTAVAVELTFTSMFLQNVRRRHSDTLSRTLSSIRTLDSSLELRLREITCDTAPNPKIVIAPPETTKTERLIDVYAYIVGSGVGVAFTTVVVITWLGLGHMLKWNSSWWLIIGTYTGLVGFIDGFVLRNVYYRQSAILEGHLQALVAADQEVFTFLGLPFCFGGGEEEGERKKSLGLRISEGMIYICAMPSAVIGSLGVVLSLIAIATGLRWSETGQLLCNTPTMIVEGFLLLVLFQAHNLGNIKRRGQTNSATGSSLSELPFLSELKNGTLTKALWGLKGEIPEATAVSDFDLIPLHNTPLILLQRQRMMIASHGQYMLRDIDCDS